MLKVLTTGANGFVGQALCHSLLERGYAVRGAVRQAGLAAGGVEAVRVGDIDASTVWASALLGVDAVVHLAARVHVMRDESADPLAAFRMVNVDGTLNLARQAAAMGVWRFVFLSSIKVNGEETTNQSSFTENDVPAPQDPYAISKCEAEQGLMRIAQETGMEVVIIRPPLVYGPGVKANFESMMRWIARGAPLLLGAVDNRRSLVGIDNLVDLIRVCLMHPAAANGVFLAGDGEDLSTADLLRRVGRALDKPARLLPVPPALLRAGARLVGKEDVARRLLGSLRVDIGKARGLLGWNPPVSVDEGLRRTAAHWLKVNGYSRT